MFAWLARCRPASGKRGSSSRRIIDRDPLRLWMISERLYGDNCLQIPAKRRHRLVSPGVTWLMKTITTPLCIALALALGASTPALADRGDYRGDYHGGQRGYYSPPHHDHDHGHSRGYGWAAPVAVLAIAGIAAGVAANAYYAPRPVYVAPPLVAPRPVYVAPRPVYVVPPSAYWNYCGSAGQYYPNVRYCPEAWQLVPAR